MREVPDGWKAAVYGDVLTETHDRRGDVADVPVLSVTKTRGPMLASERFGKPLHGRDLSKYRLAPRNTIVADPMLLWDGSIGIQRAADCGVVSPDYRVYEVSPEADVDYIASLVRSPGIRRYYQTGARGTNVRRNRIARADFLRIPFPLPPLSEQRKIAAILSSVDQVIDKAQGVIEQLQIVKRAMMQELLTRGVPGRHSRFKRTEIGEIPTEWELRDLDECITTGRPICYGILKPGKGHVGGVPVIKVKNIKGGQVVEDDLLLTTPELDEQYRRSRLQAGDVLLTIRGTTGRVAIVPATLDQANITQDTARLSIRPEVSRDYIYFGLQSPPLQRQIRDETRGQAVKGINIRDVRRLRIPVPGRDEQSEIAKALRVLLDRENAERGQLDALRTMKSALTAALLGGDVRVTPDEEAA